jgi:hypothetical protein
MKTMVVKSTAPQKEHRGLAKGRRGFHPQKDSNLRMAVEGLKKNHEAVQLFLRKTCLISPDSNLPAAEPQ